MTEIAIPLPVELLDALADRLRELLPPDPPARYVSKQKLSHLYGIEERTIKTWRSKGLPAVKVGKT